MNLLSKKAQDDIANQMCQKARDIDICLFNIIDGTMPKELLLDCLMLYETKDGFGHGLYIDNYNTNSSVYQIYYVLYLLDLVGFDSSSTEDLYYTITNKCFNYLYNRAEMKDGIWNPNVESNDSFAHSMKFSYTKDFKNTFGIAPTPAIVGYTLTLCDKNKAYYKKAYRMINQIIDYFNNQDNLKEDEYISFASFFNSLKNANIKIDNLDSLIDKLAEKYISNYTKDFNDFYKAKPFDVLLNIEKGNELKDLEADYLISNIKSFGLWDYNGSWGWDKYPEFDSASLKWIGHITAINYFYLKKYGRLEK